jgi:hypothetical protein
MEWLRQFARLFGWKNAQVETLTEWTIGQWRVRVWRTQPSIYAAFEADNRDLRASTNAIVCGRDGPTAAQIVAALAALPRIACIAIVDADGNGISVYPDWH